MVLEGRRDCGGPPAASGLPYDLYSCECSAPPSRQSIILAFERRRVGGVVVSRMGCPDGVSDGRKNPSLWPLLVVGLPRGALGALRARRQQSILFIETLRAVHTNPPRASARSKLSI